MFTTRSFWLAALLGLVALSPGAATQAADKDREITLGKLKLTAPAGWTKKEPRVRIIAYEFTAPAAGEDKIDGRCTIMAAGGSIDANIKRWYGQFSQPDGGNTEKRAKVEKTKAAGRQIHFVSVTGSYQDRRGPFAPAVTRPDYRMLSAIIEAGDANYFVKLIGPKRTVDAHEKAFKSMIKGLR